MKLETKLCAAPLSICGQIWLWMPRNSFLQCYRTWNQQKFWRVPQAPGSCRGLAEPHSVTLTVGLSA